MPIVLNPLKDPNVKIIYSNSSNSKLGTNQAEVKSKNQYYHVEARQHEKASSTNNKTSEKKN